MLRKKYVHSRKLQQPDQVLFVDIQADAQVLFKITAYDGNISEITVYEMGQLAENAICLTIPTRTLVIF